jgi:hypothetical protein
MKRYAFPALIALIFSSLTLLASMPAAATGDTPEGRRAAHALNILEAHGFAAGLQDKSVSAFLDFHAQGLRSCGPS